MSKQGYNVLVLAACLLVVAGTGIYLTYLQQPKELERLRKAVEVEEMKRAEHVALLAEQASTKAQADEVLRKWHTRYKVIPDTLTSPEVVDYLNGHTRSGFETFDVRVEAVERGEAFSRYVVRAEGRAYFTNLYRLVWELENSRLFYGIRDLQLDHIDLVTEDPETGNERLQVMVSFNMTIDAYFGGPEGASAPVHLASAEGEGVLLREGGLPPVPPAVLADPHPDVNPFFPVVMEQLPPNTHGLIDVETASFVSIVGGEAVFKDATGYRKVGVGDPVYLGEITGVDVTSGRMEARLNKGGIIDEVVLFLEAGERFRQAAGPSLMMTPAEGTYNEPAPIE